MQYSLFLFHFYPIFLFLSSMYDKDLLHTLFREKYGEHPVVTYFSPGRVNLIGEHIDYNGGFVLPAAISLGITAIVHHRSDQVVRVYAHDMQEEVVFSVGEYPVFNKKSEPLHWSDYIRATLQVMQDKNLPLGGADIVMGSDLPLGAGLSSSAALECLIAFIFGEENYRADRTQLALDAQTAERKYVGVNCGIMDQFAIANGREKEAMLLNCATLDYEYVRADFGTNNLVIINSNKSRSLAESKYNERRAECDAAFAQMSPFDPAEDLCHVHEISLGYLSDDMLYKRAKHAVLENKRVLLAAEAMEAGDMETFGQLLTESHISLDEDYEVSGHELNTIVHYSTHFDGCLGARMTGAGFGGCCIALVEKEKTPRFMQYVGKKYAEKTGLKADFFVAEMSDGVRRLADADSL